MNYYLQAISNYMNISGRASRKEFWMFSLINFCIIIGLVLLKLVLNSHFLYLIYNAFILVPTFTMTTRRLHDIGRSGWWQLIAVIPLVGILVLLVMLALDGNSHDNQFGSNPKKTHVLDATLAQ